MFPAASANHQALPVIEEIPTSGGLLSPLTVENSEGFLSFSENSMELKVIMFNKTSQIQEDKYHTFFPISKTKNPSF